MICAGRRRILLAGVAGLGRACLAAGLAGCSQEPLTRVRASVFGAPAELALYGPDGATAERLAERLWARLNALDAEWLKDPAAADARLARVLAGEAVGAAQRGTAGPPELPAAASGRDIVWRGQALDEAAALLREVPDTSALLSLGQHVLAIGERSFRPWHVGIPDPNGGQVLANFDLYADERLVTVARYALYRTRAAAPMEAPAGAAGTQACASCSVIVRGAAGARAAWLASQLFAATRADWRSQALALGADQVLWIGDDGQAEGSTLFVKRTAMADQRRSLKERP